MGDLELQRLKAVAEAVPAVLELLFALDYDHDGRVIGLSNAFDILKGRNISSEAIEYEECQDSPWATGKSASYIDDDGYWGWHFLGPDVKFKVSPPIVIKPLQQGGFVVDDQRGFTDALDMAEWLLGWLGFDKNEYHLMLIGEDTARGNHKRVLDVVEAACTYVERWGSVADYNKLAEAVRKWRGEGNKEFADSSEQRDWFDIARFKPPAADTST